MRWLPELDTDRLKIRALQIFDAPDILSLLNEPSFISGIADRGVRTVEQARKYIELGPMQSYGQHGHGLMAVVRRVDGAFVGMCGVLKRDYLPAPDLGYAIAEAHMGLGYASEAAGCIIGDAWRRLNCNELLAITNLHNQRSIAVLQKLGFQFDRQITKPDEAEPLKLFSMKRVEALV